MRNIVRLTTVVMVSLVTLSRLWAAPAQVYVDASFTPEACGGHTWGVDAFSTLQPALTAVADNGTVSVAAGVFAEKLVLNRPVTLIGAQAGIDPNAPTTNDPFAANPARTNPALETTLVPPTSDLTPAGGTLITINAPDVVIEGMVLDGDNTAVNGGIALGTADANALVGIGHEQGVLSGLLVAHTILRNFARHAIYAANSTPKVRLTAINDICYNRFVNISRFVPGVERTLMNCQSGAGVFSYAQALHIIDNTMIQVDRGVDLRVVANRPGPVALQVSGNRITSAHLGIRCNGAFTWWKADDAPFFLIDRNCVRILPPDPGNQEERVACAVGGVEKCGQVQVTENELTGGDVGLLLWDVHPDLPNGILVRGGAICGSQYGVKMVTHIEGYAGFSQCPCTTQLCNVTIEPVKAGVALIDDVRSGSTLTLQSDGVTIRGGQVGVWLCGGKTAVTGTVTLTGQTDRAVKLEENGGTMPSLPDPSPFHMQ